MPELGTRETAAGLTALYRGDQRHERNVLPTGKGTSILTTPETVTKTRDDAAQEEERGERQHAEQQEQRKPQDDQEERNPQDSQGGRKNVTGTVLKGAAVGGAAGAAIGAWAAFAKATWPEQIEQAAGAAIETVRDIGRTAARAAAQTVDPAAVVELLPGNGDRTDVVKRTARDAAAAATKAAREAISTMSDGTNGSKDARNQKEGD